MLEDGDKPSKRRIDVEPVFPSLQPGFQHLQGLLVESSRTWHNQRTESLALPKVWQISWMPFNSSR